MQRRADSATEPLAFLILALLMFALFLWQNYHILFTDSTKADQTIQTAPHGLIP